MFLLNLNTIEARYLKANVGDEAWCWHMQFGHLNFNAFKALGEKMMVNGMPSINHPNQLCEACLIGKHARETFQRKQLQEQNS